MDRELNLANEKELTALGKALSSETRIKILHVLGNGPLCVNEIAEILDIPASSAALNIRVLEDAGLIRTETGCNPAGAAAEPPLLRLSGPSGFRTLPTACHSFFLILHLYLTLLFHH